MALKSEFMAESAPAGLANRLHQGGDKGVVIRRRQEFVAAALPVARGEDVARLVNLGLIQPRRITSPRCEGLGR